MQNITLVKQRLCSSRMRWTPEGVQIILSLRALAQPGMTRFRTTNGYGGAIQSDARTLRTFAIRLVSITTAASLRFPSEFATVMTVDAKRHANFRGRLKNCQ
jgi:hypothetical protein